MLLSLAVGNSATTTKLLTARKIKISGTAIGENTFDGTKDINIPVTVPVKKVQKTINQDNYNIVATFRKQLNIVNLILEVSCNVDLKSISIQDFIPTEYRPPSNMTITQYTGSEVININSSNGIISKSSIRIILSKEGTLMGVALQPNGVSSDKMIFCVTYIVD